MRRLGSSALSITLNECWGRKGDGIIAVGIGSCRYCGACLFTTIRRQSAFLEYTPASQQHYHLLQIRTLHVLRCLLRWRVPSMLLPFGSGKWGALTSSSDGVQKQKKTSPKLRVFHFRPFWGRGGYGVITCVVQPWYARHQPLLGWAWLRGYG